MIRVMSWRQGLYTETGLGARGRICIQESGQNQEAGARSGAIQRSSIQEPGQGQVTGAEYKNWHTSRRQEQKQELATGAVYSSRDRSCIYDPWHELLSWRQSELYNRFQGQELGTEALYRSQDKSNRQEIYIGFGTGVGVDKPYTLYISQDSPVGDKISVYLHDRHKSKRQELYSCIHCTIQEPGQDQEIEVVYVSWYRSMRLELHTGTGAGARHGRCNLNIMYMKT